MRRLLLLLPLIACAPDGPARDGSQRVTAPPTCPECRIRFEPVATLGHPADPVSIAGDVVISPCAVGRLSTGEFVVSVPVGGGELLVYDAKGRVTGTIGRRGGGPGEFAGPLNVAVDRGDTLHVVDNTNARLQVVTVTGDFVRSFRLDRRVASFALLEDGNYVISPLWGSIRPGEPLFYLRAPTGELIRTVDAWDGRRTDWGEGWVVGPASPGGFWGAKQSRFAARHWTLDGTLERSLVADAEWFPPDAGLEPDFPASPPPPILSHVWQDGRGRLWLYALVAESGWEPWPGADEGRIEIGPGLIDSLFGTKVWVVQLDPPRLLAEGSSEAVLMPVCNSPLMYSAMETPEGDVRVRVLEPLLEGSPGGP